MHDCGALFDFDSCVTDVSSSARLERSARPFPRVCAHASPPREFRRDGPRKGLERRGTIKIADLDADADHRILEILPSVFESFRQAAAHP